MIREFSPSCQAGTLLFEIRVERRTHRRRRCQTSHQSKGVGGEDNQLVATVISTLSSFLLINKLKSVERVAAAGTLNPDPPPTLTYSCF